MELYLGDSMVISIKTPTFCGDAKIYGMDHDGVMFRPVKVEKAHVFIDLDNPLVFIPNLELTNGFNIPLA